MGTDLLDITYRVEKAFGIRMPFDAWLDVPGVTRIEIATGFDVTVGQFYNFILSRLVETPDGFRPPRVSRDELLNRLSLFLNLPACEIDVETDLERLLNHPDRRAEWFDLARFLDTQLPPLRRPSWLTASIALRVVSVSAMGLALAHRGNSLAWLAAVVVTGVVWLLALFMTVTEATMIPRNCRSVADLHRLLNVPPEKSEPEPPAPWSRHDVWLILQQVLVDCLAVQAAEITPNARLVADLGAS